MERDRDVWDLEHPKGVQSYHEDRSVLENSHQCNSVQHDDDEADYMAVREWLQLKADRPSRGRRIRHLSKTQS